MNQKILLLNTKDIRVVFNETHERAVYGGVVSKVWFSYIMDDYPPTAIEPDLISSVNDRDILSNQWSFILKGLSHGLHRIIVTGKIGETTVPGAGDFGGAVGTSESSYFDVENTLPIVPQTSQSYLLQIKPMTQKAPNENLALTKHGHIWRYTLNNQANITIYGKTTLTGFS